jgi:hypothetical protein
MASTQPAQAAPAGGVVTAGAAAISQQGATTTIIQATTQPKQAARMVIDWNSFSSAPGESIVFRQPNAVMQSTIKDDVLNQVFATLDDSTERQFTRTRGGLFWVAFQSLDSAELLSLHEHDSRPDTQPTPFKRGVSNFLHRAPDHIVGVVFSSRSSLSPTIAGSTDSGGATNFFLKEESSFWHASFWDPLTVTETKD